MPAKVLLRIDGVLCAAVALALPRSLEPLRVAVFSCSEAAHGGADAWGASELLTLKCALWKQVPSHSTDPTCSVILPSGDAPWRPCRAWSSRASVSCACRQT